MRGRDSELQEIYERLTELCKEKGLRPPRPPSSNYGLCSFCGVEYFKLTKRSLYCSPRCRQGAYRKRRRVTIKTKDGSVVTEGVKT